MFWKSDDSIHFLNKSEIETILQDVRTNELRTSGEIRIFIESKCPWMDPMHRAAEIFHELKMFQTAHRNAVLIYIAYKDHDFALYGDKEIYGKAGNNFWMQTAKKLSHAFYHKQQVEGIRSCVKELGTLLHTHYPHHGEQKNELPDEIVFGK
jgi:uncharacterized membrane protein